MQRVKQLTIVALVLALGGCEGTANALGLGRNPPDEFAVVDRPPLSLPPNYDLRPPRPGAPRPQEVQMPDRASQTLFGSSAGKGSFLAGKTDSTDESDGEKALLTAASASNATSNIREVIDREATQKVSGSRHLIDDVLWWNNPSASNTVVDPEAEAKRLQEVKEKGESVNSGATPVIEKGKSGWLGL